MAFTSKNIIFAAVECVFANRCLSPDLQRAHASGLFFRVFEIEFTNETL